MRLKISFARLRDPCLAGRQAFHIRRKTKFRHALKDDIQFLQVGDLLSEQTNKEILQAIDVLLKQGFHHFVVDLSRVNYMNSVGLNLLLIIRDRTLKWGGRVILTRLSPTVYRLFKMTKLYPIFELADTVEAALEAFLEQKN